MSSFYECDKFKKMTENRDYQSEEIEYWRSRYLSEFVPLTEETKHIYESFLAMTSKIFVDDGLDVIYKRCMYDYFMENEKKNRS